MAMKREAPFGERMNLKATMALPPDQSPAHKHLCLTTKCEESQNNRCSNARGGLHRRKQQFIRATYALWVPLWLETVTGVRHFVKRRLVWLVSVANGWWDSNSEHGVSLGD